MDKMKLSFKDVTPEILEVIQKVRDRLKDIPKTLSNFSRRVSLVNDLPH